MNKIGTIHWTCALLLAMLCVIKGVKMRALKCQKLVLTTGFLNKLKSDIDLQITDAAIPGLQCRYSAATGRKVFYLGYRVRGSYKQKHMKLGLLVEFSLNEIRARAINTKQDITNGLDSQAEQRMRIKQNEMLEARRTANNVANMIVR